MPKSILYLFTFAGSSLTLNRNFNIISQYQTGYVESFKAALCGLYESCGVYKANSKDLSNILDIVVGATNDIIYITVSPHPEPYMYCQGSRNLVTSRIYDGKAPCPSSQFTSFEHCVFQYSGAGDFWKQAFLINSGGQSTGSGYR